MKGLNRMALATAVAAAPFATQAMEPMSDQAMGNTTGQAGVTIQVDTNIHIDGSEYDQEVDGADTGSFLISDVAIGGIGNNPDAGAGSDGSEDFDVTIDIDLIEDGGMNLADPGAAKFSDRSLEKGDALIRLGSTDGQPVDLQVDVGKGGVRTDVGTGDLGTADNALLFSDFQVQLLLTQFDISVLNDEAFDGSGDTNTGAVGVNTTFAVDSLDVDLDVAAVSLSGVRMAGGSSLSTLRGGGDIAPGQFTTARLTIGAGTAQYALPGAGGNAEGDVLRVTLEKAGADAWVPDVKVGGGSVGNLALDNLSLTADMSIYGRP